MYIFCIHSKKSQTVYIEILHRGNSLASLWPFHDSRSNLTNYYLWKLELSQFQTQTLAVEKQNYSWKVTVGPFQSQKFARRLPLQNKTSAVTGAEVYEMLLSKVDLWGGKCRRRESGTCHIATWAGQKRNHYSNFEKLTVGRFQVRRVAVYIGTCAENRSASLRFSRILSKTLSFKNWELGRWKTARSRQRSYK